MQYQVKLQKTEKTPERINKERTTFDISNAFRSFEVRKNVQVMFSRAKDIMKGKCYVFRGCIQRNKVSLVHLECKQQQYRQVDKSLTWNAEKPQKKHTYIQESNNQRTADVFRC